MNSPSIPLKLAVLAEVLFVQLVLVWVSQQVISNSITWEKLGAIQQNVLVHIPTILVPLLLLLLFRLGFEKYGFSFKNTNMAISIALTAYIPVLIARLPLAFTNYTKLSGGIIIALAHLLALVVLAWQLQKGTNPKAGVIVIILSIIGFWGYSYWRSILPKFDYVVLSFLGAIFAALSEEILWRGYIQTRLNQVFGVPLCFLGINWGWGLIISSVLFGFAHVLNQNPTTNQIGWYWGWGIWTACAGLLFGFLREKTGGILAPFIVHGLPQAIAIGLGL